MGRTHLGCGSCHIVIKQAMSILWRTVLILRKEKAPGAWEYLGEATLWLTNERKIMGS